MFYFDPFFFVILEQLICLNVCFFICWLYCWQMKSSSAAKSIISTASTYVIGRYQDAQSCVNKLVSKNQTKISPVRFFLYLFVFRLQVDLLIL